MGTRVNSVVRVTIHRLEDCEIEVRELEVATDLFIPQYVTKPSKYWELLSGGEVPECEYE
jgi:hypothetical protein